MESHHNDDVIISQYEEVLFYWQAKEYGHRVLRLATEKEAIEFRKEYRYHEQVKAENENAGSFHEIK